MMIIDVTKIDETAMSAFVRELKLQINRRLYAREAIDERTYRLATEMILRTPPKRREIHYEQRAAVGN